MSRRYCIITPCRNEAEFARLTLDSVASQTIPPARWVIVDDGSTDDTPAILAEYENRYDFIQVVRRDDRGHRAVGPGVIEAFYDGYDTIDLDDYDYICKLDLDLVLPEVYFEELMSRMEAEPRLGTCSGKPYFRDETTGKLVSEKCGDETSIGASKFYRKECFQDIGGFVRQVMWDGIDCHRCRMNGWIACSWDDEEIRFLHLRPMGTSEHNWIRGRMRHGYGQYFMGTGFWYMSASALYRMSRPPLVIGGMAMWWGYVLSALKRTPRYEDREFRRFVRRYQWSNLLRGKKKTALRFNRNLIEHHG